MIGRSTVNCEHKSRDRYKRIIAVYFKSATNLNGLDGRAQLGSSISEVWNRLQ